MLQTIVLSTFFTILCCTSSTSPNNAITQSSDKQIEQVSGVQEEIKRLKASVETIMNLVNRMNNQMQTMSQTVNSNSKAIKNYSSILHQFDITRKEVISTVHTLNRSVNSNYQGIGKNWKNLHKIEIKNEEITSDVRKLNNTVHSNKQIVSTLTERCQLLPQSVCGPCMCVDDSRLYNKFICDCQNLPAKRDCKQFHLEGYRTSGIYKIHQNSLQIIQVFCDQMTDYGGWTVIQRRTDGSVKFYRDWISYKNGFGDLHNEFWLGNSNLFSLTLHGLLSGGNELRVELEDWGGVRRYAKYSKFEVGSELTTFQMNVGGYSGNAGDCMSYHNGHKFSTFDRDNDAWSRNCAVERNGAWWYNACECANLNGGYYDYGKMVPYMGIQWVYFHDRSYSLKFVEMKIRRKG